HCSGFFLFPDTPSQNFAIDVPFCTMLLSKRHVTYVALTFPALVYLFLMFSAIGQVCFKPGADLPELKADYLPLIRAGRTGGERNGAFLPDSVDFRRLLHAGDAKLISHAPASRLPATQRKNENSKYRDNGGARPALMFNCTSISRMKIRNKIGHGVSKQAFVADYAGVQVAIKMVTRHIHELRTCLENLRRIKIAQAAFSNGGRSDHGQKSSRRVRRDGNGFLPLEILKSSLDPDGGASTILPLIGSNRTLGHAPPGRQSVGSTADVTAEERQRCYTFPTARLMKEILLSEQLRHHNLVSLLGYCVRSEESDSTDISEHGVISVYELGARFVLDNLQILPWQARLQHAIEMADLLDYLEHSPLGSLIVPDFKEGHLVMVNGSLKLIDLDDVNSLEPECDPQDSRQGQCPYSLRCARALCEGFNAKENLKNMNKLVLKRLLFPISFPEAVIPKIGQLNADLDSLTLSAHELLVNLTDIWSFLEDKPS
ncbi:unnamed protein product, partial [Lymnaea stagnalis]